ncbi:MAG: hypothetical protein IKJ41_08335 [Clostridia bacterium]|nr:hypothetical protein [Clostridia bacterium]
MNNKNFFSGIFDFNRDGKTDISEQSLAFQIISEFEKQNSKNSDEKDESSKHSGFFSR